MILLNELDIFVKWFETQSRYRIVKKDERFPTGSIPINYVVEEYAHKRSETIAECIIAKELIEHTDFDKHSAERFARSIMSKIDHLDDDVA